MRVDPLKVIAEIPEKMAPWIKVGQPVELQRRRLSGQDVHRQGVAHQPGGQHRDARVPVRSAGAEQRRAAQAGHVRARAHRERRRSSTVLTVPYSAMQYRYGVNRVFVVDGDKLTVRELKVGDRLGDRIEIVSGVKAGERVAVDATSTSWPTALKVTVDKTSGVAHVLRTLRPPAGVRDDAGDVARRARDLLVPRSRRRSVPEGRSGDGQRHPVAARREPRRDVVVGDRADGAGDQRRLRHRRDLGAHQRGQGQHHRPLRARARPQRRRQRRAREGRRRDQERAAGAAAAGHHQGRPGRRPGDVADGVVRRDEPADADRDRRQAGLARRSRRSTASAR